MGGQERRRRGRPVGERDTDTPIDWQLLNDAITEHLAAHDMRETALSTKAKIGKSTVGTWLKGKSRPSIPSIEKVAAVMGADPAHLRALANRTPAPPAPREDLTPRTATERALMTRFRALSKDTQLLFLRTVELQERMERQALMGHAAEGPVTDEGDAGVERADDASNA